MHRPARAVAVIILLLPLCLAPTACIQDDGERWHPLRRFELINPDEEREMGMQFDRDLRKQIPVITDPVVTAFISDLGQQLLDGIDDEDYIYRFRVVKDNQLNAFAVPGGYIYFHSGTILSASSIDELAGVMGHEIAHVEARHYAHRRQASQIRQVLATVPLIVASVAAEQPGLLMTGMAMNVALELKFSRTQEAESDRLGAVYAARSGYDPAASAVFFERILEQQSLYANGVPPYLFSHPAVEDRIAEVRSRATNLAPVIQIDTSMEDRFKEAQARLAQLVETNRVELPGIGTRIDHSHNDVLLQRAENQRQAGEPDAALATLAQISLADPTDPRVSFRIGELLMEESRIRGAIAAFRRTTELDSSRALVFYRLGLAYKADGDRQRAVYALEQAIERSSPSSKVNKEATWEVVKLSFGVISESGFADGRLRRSAGTPAGDPVEAYPENAGTLAWWGRVSPPLLDRRSSLRLRWRSPSGHIVMQEEGDVVARVYLRSLLEFDGEARPEPGIWTVEVLLDGDTVHRSRARVGS